MANPQPGTLAHGNNAGTLVPLKVSSDGTLATSGAGGGGSTVAIDQTTPGTTNAVQVTAGTAVIGHVIVDSGGGTPYTEDVAAAADPIGPAQILVRLDTLVAITNADGDNIAARGTNKGEAYTHDTDTLAAIAAAAIPVGAGTAAAAGRVTLASDDPAVATLGVTTGTKVVTDATGTLQQYLRGLVTFLANALGAGTAATASRVVTATDDTIHGALTETAPATDTASSGLNGRLQRIAQRLTSMIALLPTALAANGGLKIEGVASGVAVPISVASLPSGAVTNAGTFAVQPKGSSATNVAIADNPVNLGVQAVSSENTAVTTARQVQLVADLVGKLIVLPYANPENFVSGTITSAMTGTTSTSLMAAPAAGLRNYITQITISNASITVPTDILIQDGSGGTTLYVIPCPIGTGTGTGTSGGTFVFPTPLRQPTTATAIYCANVTTGSSTKASISGYKGA